MTHALRPARLALLAFALALFFAALLSGVQSGVAAGSSETANAAALKKCKPGWNNKKCRCPKSKQRVKRNGRYRCKARAVSDPAPDPGADPAPGGEVPQPPPGAQPVRDDAGFEAALNSTLLRKFEEGSYGYGRYAYNFLGDHQFLYCSYYYAGSTVESNKVGTWQVAEGYTLPSHPGYAIGAVRLTGSDFDVRIGVEVYNNQSNVESGNVSGTFTEGAFSRAIGGAVTNCSAVPE
jgi:hypothetical protein